MATVERTPVREAEERAVEETAARFDARGASGRPEPGVMSRVPSASRFKSNEEPHLEHAGDSSEFSVRHCGQITIGLLFPQMLELWDYHPASPRLQAQVLAGGLLGI
jgi:hypothetical protein